MDFIKGDNKIYFKDFYGNTASIEKEINRLIICNQSGSVVMDKTFNTFKGAKISLGRYSGGDMKEVEAEKNKLSQDIKELKPSLECDKMKPYKIDYDLSKRVYEQYKDIIEIKQCYNNSFTVATTSQELGFFDGKCKLGYCYMDIGFIGLLVRHCVIITEDNKLIDVTAFASDNEKERILRRDYYIFEELDDKQVFKMVNATNHADNSRSRKELKAYKELFENNIFFQLNEGDFLEYVFPKLIKEKSKKRKTEKINQKLKEVKKSFDA